MYALLTEKRGQKRWQKNKEGYIIVKTTKTSRSKQSGSFLNTRYCFTIFNTNRLLAPATRTKYIPAGVCVRSNVCSFRSTLLLR